MVLNIKKLYKMTKTKFHSTRPHTKYPFIKSIFKEQIKNFNLFPLKLIIFLKLVLLSILNIYTKLINCKQCKVNYTLIGTIGVSLIYAIFIIIVIK